MTYSRRIGLGSPSDPLNNIPTNQRNNNKNNNNNNRNSRSRTNPRRARQRASSNNNSAAKIAGTSNGIRVHHTEYITGVTRANAGYSVPVYEGQFMKLSINPGDGEMFPWLSRIATKFDKYRIHRLSLEYQPTAAFTAAGGVCLSFEADPTNDEPKSLAEFLNKSASVKGHVASYTKLVCPVQAKELHVRHTHSSTHVGADMRHMDAGTIYCLVYNVDEDPFSYGELKVTYDISLQQPTLTASVVKSHRHKNTAIDYSPAGTYTPALGDMDDEAMYLGDGTIGVMTHHQKGLLSGATPAESTRLTFKEPFSGRLTVRTNPLTGTMLNPPGLIHNDVLTKPAGDDAPVAKHSIVSVLGELASGVAVVWDVVANGGDILDLIWSQLGTLKTSSSILELTEMALPLLTV